MWTLPSAYLLPSIFVLVCRVPNFAECFLPLLLSAIILPSVFVVALGKELLYWVSDIMHSAKILALGKLRVSGSDKRHNYMFFSCLFFSCRITVRDDVSIVPIWLPLYFTWFILFLTIPQSIYNVSFCVISIGLYSDLWPAGINLCQLPLRVADSGVSIKLYQPTTYTDHCWMLLRRYTH